MRFTNILSAALVAGPLAVSAKGFLSWSIGNVNTDNSCKVQSDWEADFAALKASSAGATVVRVYTSSGCNTAAAVIPAAKSAGLKVMLGVWLGVDDSSFYQDTAALQATVPGNEDAVYAILVGSEGLYRGDYDGNRLLSKVLEAQSMFPSVTIGTADTWNMISEGKADPAIQGGLKLILANAFAYWQGQDISNATATYFDDVGQAIAHVQQVSGSLDAVHIMSGETGWPTDGGSDYEAAVAGTANAATYWKSAVCGLLDWGVDISYFEAFDEPTKPDATGLDGKPASEAHWGAFYANRTSKFDLSC